MNKKRGKEGFKEFEHFSLWIEEGIIYFVYKPDIIVTLDIAKHMVAERMKLSNEIVRPILLDVRDLLSVDAKAREFLASKEASYFLSAGAILLNNPLIRLAGNIFLLIDKPLTPAKLFTDEKLALQWLELFKHLN